MFHPNFTMRLRSGCAKRSAAAVSIREASSVRSGRPLCRLTASLVLYRSDDRWPEGCRRRLTDVVPVWWEFHTVTADGEMPNDFSFAELRPCLLV